MKNRRFLKLGTRVNFTTNSVQNSASFSAIAWRAQLKIAKSSNICNDHGFEHAKFGREDWIDANYQSNKIQVKSWQARKSKTN